MTEIGIIGVGIVGSALKYGFEKLGHNVKVHDLRLETKIEDILDTETCYICVPTPSKDMGECDTTIVESVVEDLISEKYKGIIAIKSTVSPGTTERLLKKNESYWFHVQQSKFPSGICFVPEFLRERCASSDFTENHDLLVIGTQNDWIASAIRTQHGKYPKNVVQMPPTEAELVKYFNNIYNATLVTFANSFYEVCKVAGADYSVIKDAIVKRDHIHDVYLDVNENFRGFSGQCLPKDLKAIANLCKKHGADVGFFDAILKENSRYKATVFEGMRGE